ncbi:hypothetical protein F4679DRAFT_599885 [Xylaria curta]|nr:hypothetical protein F4679DRAFT_599885 [Xylaria curta]
MNYVARLKIFETEKAFFTDFPVSSIPGARQSNHQVERTPIQVHPIQDYSRFDLNVNGFCVIRAETSLNSEQAFTKSKDVKKAYWAQIERILEHRFPEYTRIEGFDFTVRKREHDFPAISRLYGDYEQPLNSPHIDWTAKGSELQMQDAFPGQDHSWRGKDYDIINVWRPLIGPSDDWPLAVCDWTSIDQNQDVLLNDGIRRDKVDENATLHPNKAHRWYYIKDQTTDELVVFRNSHSKEKLPCCFHSAVFNPQATGPPRVSIEVRLVAFRDLL